MDGGVQRWGANMKGNAGKWAEKQTQEWLDAQSLHDSTFAFHRFPDARAARGGLASQPSDHLVVHRGVVTFLETKETKELRRLPRTKVSQIGMLLKFHLAGASVAVLVHRSEYHDWVLFTAQHLFPKGPTPASFPFDGLLTYPTAAAALGEFYQ